MVRKKIALSLKENFSPCDIKTEAKFTLENLMELYQKFINKKTLEGLSARSLKDYNTHFNYLMKYLLDTLGLPQSVELKAEYFNEYIAYMKLQKGLSNNTINIRLRTIRAFLRWLNKEDYIINIHSKIKLLKTPIDTVHPLSASEVKSLLKLCNLNTFVGLRDYTVMVLILDTGIRINELLNLKIDDVNLKTGIITVRAEIAKTRASRFLPLRSFSKLL
ncbi:hypothetical protein CPJCM30710_27900 [Clostridium polyendosporum]|uniref:Uncharacterized protein n=1 Tax=Clostridium polyendosporum TaxID=69208 RepID=A0A919S290_9CLOT|nr:tyrosine-type recombinase/integrase [Clostridium polyendosporum]GIM30124.1 hypothetical protein CPJCM30710_27900 [Clostridium polyendosporum]